MLGRKTAKSWLRTSDLAQPTDLDALLVPGFWAESPEHVQSVVGANDRLVAMLARLPKTTLVWSYCTGVCLLAAAGKLNRQPATVTWWKIKLDQVSERLIMTSAPASTISAELGFSSDSGMRRMFKDLTALTPSQYRQMFGRS
ncbi:transcriptional regulator GlxA family with amidase domain [Paraburkholderia atlantica]